MMKELVVHVIDRLPPDGAERLIAEVLKNRSNRYDYHVLCLVEGGLLREEIEASGVPVTVLGRRNGHDIRHALALYKWFRHYKPKVVHTHLFTADAWGRTFAWLARVPGIFSTVHSTNAWKSQLHLVVDKFLSRFSNAVIACTDEVKSTIELQGISSGKVISIANGVDLQRVDAAPVVDIRTDYAIPDESVVFALVGRLHEAKGHAELLPVLQQLHQKDKKFICLFVGEGDLEDTLKQQVKLLGLTEKIEFTGFRTDVIGILKAIDFLVMPSRWEGLPISLLESMACQSPVLASRVGGIPDVIEHGVDGLLFEQGNTTELESSLSLLIDNKELRQKLATAGLQKIHNRYSAASVAEAYEALYNKVS